MGKEAPLKREGQGGPTRASREAPPLRAPVHPGGRGTVRRTTGNSRMCIPCREIT